MKTAMVVKLPAAPGKRDELVQVLSELFAGVESEPGTELYGLFVDTTDENAVWFWELYADDDALALHSRSDTMKSVLPRLGALLGGAPDMRRLEPVKGKGFAV